MPPVTRKYEKHGLRKTPEYGVYRGLLNRVSNKNFHEYPRYGGRGITVCDRWANSFLAFYADMGPRPGSEYSVERIDNDGPYCETNCKWATRIEQNNNQRSNWVLTVGPRVDTLSNWCRSLGLNPGTVRHRMRVGWSDAQALGITPKPDRNRARDSLGRFL